MNPEAGGQWVRRLKQVYVPHLPVRMNFPVESLSQRLLQVVAPGMVARQLVQNWPGGWRVAASSAPAKRFQNCREPPSQMARRRGLGTERARMKREQMTAWGVETTPPRSDKR